MNLDDAAAAHMQWKIKFRAALSGGEAIDPAKISRDDVCPLGLWLKGEARAKYGRLAAFSACAAAHTAFHNEAGKVARLIAAKDTARATAALNASSPFAKASSGAMVAIERLKKEVGAQAA